MYFIKNRRPQPNPSHCYSMFINYSPHRKVFDR